MRPSCSQRKRQAANSHPSSSFPVQHCRAVTESQRAWESEKEQRQSNPGDLEGLTTTHPEPTPAHPRAWHFPGEMMYKHSHTCWAHSHLLLPKQWQSVAQFSPSSLTESPPVSVFSGRKVSHGQEFPGSCLGYDPFWLLFFCLIPSVSSPNTIYLSGGYQQVPVKKRNRENKWPDRQADQKRTGRIGIKPVKSEKEISALKRTDHWCLSGHRREVENCTAQVNSIKLKGKNSLLAFALIAKEETSSRGSGSWRQRTEA